jgi:8-oxo-dGTP diphosphatase
MDLTLHVVAGVLGDAEGRVLFAQRAAGAHLAGTWEFPGGKIEAGESAEAALRRELHEELGVAIGRVEPLISVPWRYPQKAIVLHAFRVLDFSGEPHAREHQAVRWLRPDEAFDIDMPPPDRPIVSALRLPHSYAITPEPDGDDERFLSQLRTLFALGARLVQLRARQLPAERLRRLAAAARDLARAAGTTLLLNGNLPLVRELGLDGVQLPAVELMRLTSRPLERGRWVAASVHDERELAHAAGIGADFAVLGTVRPTPTHPTAVELGWTRFGELCAGAALPVYAIGGLRPRDLDEARRAGAQGIAGISGFWPDS